MSLLTLVLAVTLAAGNAEFDRTALDGARAIAVRKAEMRLADEGPEAGGLQRQMLAEPADFAKADEAQERARALYRRLLEAELAAETAKIDARLGQASGGASPVASSAGATNGWVDAAMKGFAARYAAERKAACIEQARMITCKIRPAEADFETGDEGQLRRQMTAKVAAEQKHAVFEENLKYISETMVDPVIDSAKKEMKRQRDYLMRTKCDSYAPSALAREIEANLRKNVESRQKKTDDPSQNWGVFPKTLKEGLAAAVERRTLDRVSKGVEVASVALDVQAITQTMVRDPKAHRRARDSEQIFAAVFSAQVLGDAISQIEKEAPSKERDEFAEYARAHAAAPEIVRAVESRVRREVLPKWRLARAEFAKTEAERLWPTLADGTWYPEAELADKIAASSDYGKAVRRWRSAPELESLAKAGAGQTLMEETEANADKSVSAAFDLARNAIAAQNALVDEVEPSVLHEAKDRKSSFWRRTPDLKAIIGLLTEGVETRWNERRVGALWPEGNRPKNAAEQHKALFPSVRKRIELVARSILEQMEKPEPEPEEKPKDPSESEQQSEEPPMLMFSIVVEKDGDEVKVRLDQGKATVAERTAKAKMSDYQGAMKFVSDKLGREILQLK